MVDKVLGTSELDAENQNAEQADIYEQLTSVSQ